jgi:hypothetical protein
MNSSLEDCKTLIKAVIENAMSDYIKLQHPANRKKKYLQESLIVATAMFFDKSFRFTIFFNSDGTKMSLQDALEYSIGYSSVASVKFINNLLKEMETYWWEKHFQNIKIPNDVSICGRLFFIKQYTEQQSKEYDNDKLLIFLNKNDKNKDRMFINTSLKIMVDLNEIEISEDDFDKLSKSIYLFIKVNGGFLTENDTTT